MTSITNILIRASKRTERVGYLKADENYPRGEVSESVFEGLVRLVEHPLGCWCGHHDCDLDPCGSPRPLPELRYKGVVIPTQCSTDIFIPAETVVYAAPALILHYIRGHNYLPPPRFLKAVIACPDPRSPEYVAALEQICPPNVD